MHRAIFLFKLITMSSGCNSMRMYTNGTIYTHTLVGHAQNYLKANMMPFIVPVSDGILRTSGAGDLNRQSYHITIVCVCMVPSLNGHVFKTNCTHP